LGSPKEKTIKCEKALTVAPFLITLSLMKLLTVELMEKLSKAGADSAVPLCKLFTPWGAGTWLITGIEHGILYGFADLGMGCVEWGSIGTLGELEAIRGRFGLKIERDLFWTARADLNYFELDSLVGI
jgi:hypothetical protein